MGSKGNHPPGVLPPSIQLQAGIRENATEIQNYLSDLSNWSKEMRARELASSGVDLPPPGEGVPLRSDPAAKKKQRSKGGGGDGKEKSKIPRGDYSAWEKFDADKACEEVGATTPTPQQPESEEDAVKRRAIEIRLQKMGVEKKELGNQALKDKEYEKAVEHYTEGIRCDKKSAVLYANRAQAHIFLKQYTKAVEDCSSSIANDASYVKAYFRRAKARFSLGKLVDAKADLEHTLTLEAGNVEAKQLLNEISRRTMESLFSKGPQPPPLSVSRSAPATPAERDSHFPGVLTQLLGGSNYFPPRSGGGGTGGGMPHPYLRPYSNPNYDDDEDLDLGGGGDNEIYPKNIIPIFKPPAKRSKRPLLPIHVKVIGNGAIPSPGGGDDKKMRFSSSPLDWNGNEASISSSSSSTASSVSSTALPSPSSASGSLSVSGTPTTQLPSLFSQLQVQTLPPKPATAAQFGLDWRKLKGNSELAAQYLAQLSSEEDYAMFGESLEYGRLSEILDLLLWEFLPRGWPILHHLQGLAGVKRFSTLALFMTERDRANARKLISEVHPAAQGPLYGKYALK